MTPSNAEPTDDYKELIISLNAHSVEFVIVGAYAVGHHGYIRGTKDLDILVNATPENAVKVAAALKDFAAVDVDPKEIRDKTRIVLGRDPNSVDILTSITGVSWERAWSGRVQGHLRGQSAAFLSVECLVDNKRAADRPKDHFDLQGLGAEPLQKPKPGPGDLK